MGGTTARPENSLDSHIDKLDAAQFGVKEVALNVSGGSEKMRVELTGLTKGNASFGGGGTVTLPGTRRSSLDLRFDVEKMALTEILPNTMKFAGDVTAAVFVKGSAADPEMNAELESEEIQIDASKSRSPRLQPHSEADAPR